MDLYIVNQNLAFQETHVRSNLQPKYIMAYGSTPYVGMALKKNGDHIKSAQMTRSKCLR